uniref:Uncharacterized protein n=1 Tax=Anguilla anguilla TaxID=7936 RepID=A0A0E9W8R3_ANGAN
MFKDSQDINIQRMISYGFCGVLMLKGWFVIMHLHSS